MKCDSNVLAFFCPSANKQWLFITRQLQWWKELHQIISAHIIGRITWRDTWRHFLPHIPKFIDLFLNRKISHVFPNDYRKIYFVTWRIFDGTTCPRTICRQLNERGSFYNIQKYNFSLSTITTTRLFSQGSGEFSPSFHQNIS